MTALHRMQLFGITSVVRKAQYMNDLRTIFLGPDRAWIFLVECGLRTAMMFLIVLLLFKLTGKKEVRQFSILELIVIIGMGSALGDPMIYEEVAILPSAVAMFVVLTLYWIMNRSMNRNRSLEKLVEGRVVRLFSQGRLELESLQKEGLTVREFYGELRTHHVSQLGQVKSAYLEIDGSVSVFFHPDEEVQPGLPILPELLRPHEALVIGPAACASCGSLSTIADPPLACSCCGNGKWVQASTEKRVT